MSRLIFALLVLALLYRSVRAQDAVLVLSPSATTSVVAGNGTAGLRGDGAAAAAAQLAHPSAVARGLQGDFFIADTRNHRIRRITAGGTISTVAGSGTQGFAGDEGPATQAQLDTPSGLAISADGSLWIADTHNQRVRRVDPAGIVHTVAGTGTRGFSGDGAAATNAQLNNPLSIAIGLVGDLFIADAGNHRVRHVSADGLISTVAGDGLQGKSPEGIQATLAHLDKPASVSVRADGSLLIADSGNNRVVLLQTDGTLHTLNTGSMSLRRPGSVATSSEGDTLIADTANYRVAQISSSGAGSVLGSGEQGLANISVAPTAAALGAPSFVADTSANATGGQISVLDRDASQLLQVSLPRLGFADTVVGSASVPKLLLLRNAGPSVLSVTGIAVPASFTTAATSSCATTPFQLQPGSSCQLNLVFTPQITGQSSGLLQVTVQNGLAQRATLSGTGLPSGTQLPSITSLQTNGTISYAGSPLLLAVSVLGGSAAPATGVVTFLDGSTELGTVTLNALAQATLSTTSLAVGPHSLSARYNGDLRYLGSTSALSQVSVAIPPDFTVTPGSSSPIVLRSGNPGALALILQPTNGVLNRSVTISVDGLPSGSAISVTPVPVTLAGDPVTVNVAFKLPVSLSRKSSTAILVVCAAPFLTVFARRRRRLYPLPLALLLLLLQGCGGGYLSGKSATSQSAGVTYAVTVTAACAGVTGATLTHNASFTVEVQP